MQRKSKVIETKSRSRNEGRNKTDCGEQATERAFWAERKVTWHRALID